MKLATKYLNDLICNIEKSAVQKNQDYENETTYYVFEDGSAIFQTNEEIGVVLDYGLNKDYEQL